ncbi:unnamed protein product [Caenorhabditis auriculariae]|uniref:glucuronosyltransferase n=1 Tax=Caenorhabditis auriculariae TaxID=2777116 RepID=A0A8S1HJQ1_9PELO|nr:unnamed protein product [Caenorhabditis auriculariae]
MVTLSRALLFSCALIWRVNCLNILVWGTTIGHSHIAFLGGIGDILQKDGHNVTMFLFENDPEVTTNDIPIGQIIRYNSPLVPKDEWSKLNFKSKDVFQTHTMEIADFFRMQSVNHRVCQTMVNDDHILQVLRNSKFDLAIVELFHFCPAGILEFVGVPKIILATALGMTYAHYELLDLHVPMSHVPAQMTHLGSRIPFFGRFYNVLFNYASKFCYYYSLYQDQFIFIRRFGKFPRLDELYKKKIDYVFTNTNEFTESTRPTLQSIKNIGGSTMMTPKPLDKDFDSILSSAQKGTILFSLGSLVKPETMPKFIEKAFLDAFSEFPEYKFIVKGPSESNFTYPNIHYRKWIPQVDLLADGRVKVFITHSGMNSLHEALAFGVPTITMPIFGDQDSNAVIAFERGYSYQLNKFTVTKARVVEAIRAVIGENGQESSYTRSARRAARILKGTRPSVRREIARLAKVSGSEPQLHHLRLNADHLNYIEYYNIDVYLVLLGSVFTVLYAFFRLWPYGDRKQLFAFYELELEVIKEESLSQQESTHDSNPWRTQCGAKGVNCRQELTQGPSSLLGPNCLGCQLPE